MKSQFDPNKNQFITPWKLLFAKFWLLTVALICYQMLFDAYQALAQDGSAGINSATTQVKSYFDAGCNLMYAIGAVTGIIGAIKVYQKWNHGDHDTGKV